MDMGEDSEEDLSKYKFIHGNEELKIRLVPSEEWDETKEPPNPLDEPLVIIKRAEWGAAPPVSKEHNCNPLNMVLINDTRGEQCFSTETCKATVKQLQTYYMQEKGMTDIPWNFLVGSDGNVYEGRGWTSKAGKYTELHKGMESLDIAYIGNFQVEEPSLKLTTTVERLINKGIDKNCIDLEYKMRSDLLNDYEDDTPDPPVKYWRPPDKI